MDCVDDDEEDVMAEVDLDAICVYVEESDEADAAEDDKENSRQNFNEVDVRSQSNSELEVQPTDEAPSSSPSLNNNVVKTDKSAGGSLSMPEWINKCSFQCSKCPKKTAVEFEDFESLYCHTAKNHPYLMKTMDKKMLFATSIVKENYHGCRICNNIVKNDAFFVTMHLRKHGDIDIGRYNDLFVDGDDGKSEKRRSGGSHVEGNNVSESSGTSCKARHTHVENCGVKQISDANVRLGEGPSEEGSSTKRPMRRTKKKRRGLSGMAWLEDESISPWMIDLDLRLCSSTARFSLLRMEKFHHGSRKPKEVRRIVQTLSRRTVKMPRRRSTRISSIAGEAIINKTFLRRNLVQLGIVKPHIRRFGKPCAAKKREMNEAFFDTKTFIREARKRKRSRKPSNEGKKANNGTGHQGKSSKVVLSSSSSKSPLSLSSYKSRLKSKETATFFGQRVMKLPSRFNLLEDEQASSSAITRSIANACLYKCKHCNFESSVSNQMYAHNKNEHGISMKEAWVKRAVFHECGVCGILLYCDRSFINYHANDNHGLSMKEYRLCLDEDDNQPATKMKKDPILPNCPVKKRRKTENRTEKVKVSVPKPEKTCKSKVMTKPCSVILPRLQLVPKLTRLPESIIANALQLSEKN